MNGTEQSQISDTMFDGPCTVELQSLYAFVREIEQVM